MDANKTSVGAGRRIATRAAVGGAVIAAAVIGFAGPSQAAVVDNGIATNSLYLSRGETRYLNARLEFLGATGGTGTLAGCAYLATINPLAGAACAVGAGGYGTALVHATQSAARGNGCLRVRYTNPNFSGGTSVIVGFYNDGGKHCKS
jgi:hypothetical protein